METTKYYIRNTNSDTDAVLSNVEGFHRLTRVFGLSPRRARKAMKGTEYDIPATNDSRRWTRFWPSIFLVSRWTFITFDSGLRGSKYLFLPLRVLLLAKTSKGINNNPCKICGCVYPIIL